MLGLFPVPLIVIKFKDHHKYDFPEVEKEDRKPFNWVDSVNTSFPIINDDDPVISPVVRDNLKSDLKDSIVDLAHQIQRMADKQDEMLDDVKKIKEAIYNPDQGLYARVRDLEQWQQGVAKFIWTVGLAVAGLIIQAIYSNLF